MRKSWTKWMRLIVIAFPPSACLAAEGGSRIVLVADGRRFSGLEAWWANLYNESLLAFTVVTIVVVPVLGFALGLASDLVMRRLGINLRSRNVAEH